MQKLSVRKVIIAKQIEDSENYEQFLDIVKEKNICVIEVDSGDKISIEKNLYFDVLWPDNSSFLSENKLNNNSLVCKLNYNNFSMLFTGDIEKNAEKEILSNINNDLLKADILKVAHHGSKTSSTSKFLESVKPEIAFIGVGENNKFGHPNDDVLNRLEELRDKNL